MACGRHMYLLMALPEPFLPFVPPRDVLHMKGLARLGSFVQTFLLSAFGVGRYFFLATNLALGSVEKAFDILSVFDPEPGRLEEQKVQPDRAAPDRAE